MENQGGTVRSQIQQVDSTEVKKTLRKRKETEQAEDDGLSLVVFLREFSLATFVIAIFKDVKSMAIVLIVLWVYEKWKKECKMRTNH